MRLQHVTCTVVDEFGRCGVSLGPNNKSEFFALAPTPTVVFLVLNVGTCCIHSPWPSVTGIRARLFRGRRREGQWSRARIICQREGTTVRGRHAMPPTVCGLPRSRGLAVQESFCLARNDVCMKISGFPASPLPLLLPTAW